MTRRGVAAVLAAFALAACSAATQTQGPGQPRAFSQPIYDAQGQAVGLLTLTAVGRDSTRVTVEATHLPTGTHGTHLHTTGRCDAPAFTTAGGHLNPANRQHGMRNPRGPHLGDLPNLVVGANGMGRLEAVIAGSTRPGQAPLFDADGTALVIHAGADDMVTDPAGNSGARIACSVIAAPTTS
ncbi:MAG TPA: superoxide dismutase family protein [Longimicrobiaceae bacterium]|nr:superoxide dismutase family protein [Longimicrobiaceae bacterium]